MAYKKSKWNINQLTEEQTRNRNVSPKGTEWALGTIATTDDLESLDYKNLKGAVGNMKTVVGKDLILHLIEDDIYLDFKFYVGTRWGIRQTSR